MNDSDFVRHARKDPQGIVDVRWDDDRDGWMIVGPEGVYADGSQPRVFPRGELSKVHQKIQEWGYRKFIQEGEEKDFFSHT